MAVSDYSTTPVSNSVISTINISEQCPAGGINDAIRQLMADVKQAIAAEGTTLTASSSLDLGTGWGFTTVTGAASITALGTVAAGAVRRVRFTGASTVVHNATNLIIPGGGNVSTASGDVLTFLSLGSGNWALADGLAETKFHFDNLGNVSFGTATPQNNTGWTTLTLQGSTGAVLELQAADGAKFGRIYPSSLSTAVTIENLKNGPIILKTNSGTERVRVNGSGGIAVNNPTSLTSVPGTSEGMLNVTADTAKDGINVMGNSTNHTANIARPNAGNYFGFIVGSYPGGLTGTISTNGTTTAYNTSSDYRLKNVLGSVLNACDRIMALNPVCFEFKKQPGIPHDGFLAHEAAEVVPQAVTGRKDEVTDEGRPVYQAMDYAKVVPLLTAALQEAVRRIGVLEQRLAP